MSAPRRVPVILAILAIAGCVGVDDSTGVSLPRTITLAATPRFAVEPSPAVVAALDRARLRLVDRATDSVLVGVERAIDPSAREWAFDLTLELLENQVFDVRLDIEFIDTDPIVDVVEFAGRTTFKVQASFEPQVIREINLGRGPLENLSLTGLTVSGARSRIQEGGHDRLDVDTIGAGPGQIIYFESSNPTVASVDSMGNIAALVPGSTLIIARGGRVADTLDLAVGKVELPTTQELQASLVPQADYVTDPFFLATLSDGSTAAELRDAIEVLVAEMLAGRGFEAVGRFEEAEEIWERYGSQSGVRYLDGPQLGVVTITLIHAADALGIDFLRN